MNTAAIIIIVLTFFAAVIEKFSDKPIEKRKGILKKLKLENIAILLLGILLIVQLYNSWNLAKKEEVKEAKSTESYNRILKTQEKVNEANDLIDSILLNIKNEIEFTKREFEQVAALNNDLEDVRLTVKQSLLEYKKLNKNYSEQLALEKQRVLDSKPNLKVYRPRSMFDSTYIFYQFQLVNHGNRMADSVRYKSIMVLVDTNSIFSKATGFRNNLKSHNILRIPPNLSYNYIANGIIAPINKIEKYDIGFLLVKFSCYDSMIDVELDQPTEVFICKSISNHRGQYGLNSTTKHLDQIKYFLKSEYPDMFETFF